MNPHRRALIELHVCVVLWGFTAILGKLITLPAQALVWWRMLLVTLALACFPRVWRGLAGIPPRLIAIYAGIGAVVARALAGVLRLGEAGERLGGGHLHGAGPGGDGAHRARDHGRAIRTT